MLKNKIVYRPENILFKPLKDKIWRHGFDAGLCFGSCLFLTLQNNILLGSIMFLIGWIRFFWR